MSLPIKCGIIGCGVIAPTHIQSYQLLPGVQVEWACDLVESKARKLADQYGIPQVTTDINDVLADPSVSCVSICTDHASHSPLVIAALKAGKHILCEKALAASRTGLQAIFDARADYPDVLFAGVFQHRFDPVNRCLKRLIGEGVFGTLLTAGVQMRCLRTREYYNADKWRGTWEEEGGAVLINQAIHYIDQVVWLMGGVEALCGTYANLTHHDSMETEDTAVASLRFRNGAIGTLEATCSSNLNWEPTLSFHGSEGSLDIRHDKVMKISFRDAKVQAYVEAQIADSSNPQGVDAGKTYYGTGHPAQIADFVAAIREQRQPYVTAEAARHTVEVVLAIYESHRTRQWINL